ncbi:DUF3147 family protein [Nitrosomonas sp. Is37]|uniref:DUF3147 family protein n=1 Tax=Nitrosomonas sp. Is37 TaxID=3080535 RepID=UPI00294B77D7|nr:DUF3147 family protein [Nitrosomonas sp. Is37]MDV6343532.1 DUF3147 family protein [Nitrosomonas sp. Is37]
MLYYTIKLLVTAILIVAITEITKRNTGIAALVASLPFTALLAFVWLYVEGSPLSQIADLSYQIFWLVLPSLLLFLLFPILLKQGLGFWLSLSLSAAATVVCYFALLPLLRRFGVQL